MKKIAIAGRHRRGLLDGLKNPPASHSLTCLLIYLFSNRKNRRKDGGIYSLSILQAEASGIHDGRWFGGGRCRCCQDARHRLQGRFGTCFLFRSHVVTRQKFSRHTFPTPGGQVEITPYFLETRMQSGRRPFDNIIHRYWTGYLGISRSSRGVNFDRHFTRLDGLLEKLCKTTWRR